MRTRLFRYWKYARDGFNLYLGVPVAVFNFLSIAYYLTMERIPLLKGFFQHFILFAVSALLIGVPLAVILGWLHTKRGVLATEQTLAMENNPLAVRQTVVSLEATVTVLEQLGITPSIELLGLLQFWKGKLSELEKHGRTVR